MTLFWSTPLSGIETVALAIWVTAASAVAYVYIGYLAVLAMVSLISKKRKTDAEYTPTLSVLIPAYNEEAHIERKLRQTLNLRYPPDRVQILVVSDGSTDQTDKIVANLAAEEPRVQLLRVEGRRGKTHAQNEAVKQCTGEVIIFSDATTTYHPDALRYLAAHYSDPLVGAVSGRYKYFDVDGGSPTGLGSIAFWNYENMIKLFQSRIHTLTGCSGCIYSVRKSVYTPLPDDACSDLVEPLCVVRRGFRVPFEPRALAYEETTKTSKQEFAMRIRVGTRGIRGVLSVSELLNPFTHAWISVQLCSHKLLRWAVPVLLIALFVSSVVLLRVPAFQIATGMQVAFYGLAVLTAYVPLHRKASILGIPLYFCTLNAAVLMSVIEVVRRRQYTVWETIR